MLRTAVALLAIGLAAAAPLSDGKKHCVGACRTAKVNSKMTQTMQQKIREHALCELRHECPNNKPAMSVTPCVGGMSGEYACKDVDLLSYVNIEEMGGKGDGNDIWGWTDPETDKEIAIVCLEDGTSFVDVTDPENPAVLGIVMTHSVNSLWRDAKVYNDHVFIVSEANNHGMQVVDLTKLRGLKGNTAADGKKKKAVPELSPDAVYTEVTSTHNIVINEASATAYLVGSRTCAGGLHMVNISSPKEPEFMGCFDEDGYTHDSQCDFYTGPDTRYTGQEICYNYNEDTITITDVTDKTNPIMLGRMGYDNSYYTHQGWTDASQEYLFMNDELDEQNGPDPRTRTLIWDIKKLDDPKLVSSFYSTETVIDHNLYVDGKVIFESNYCAGLRVLEIKQTAPSADPTLEEIGFYDVDPSCDTPRFAGAWSIFPYFKSGTVILSSIERGLFVLKPKFTGKQYLKVGRDEAHAARLAKAVNRTRIN